VATKIVELLKKDFADAVGAGEGSVFKDPRCLPQDPFMRFLEAADSRGTTPVGLRRQRRLPSVVTVRTSRFASLR
jgi:hypothetical protein